MISDFRVHIQLSDAAGQSEFGTPRFTNWYSERPIWSKWATDANGYDPDGARLWLEKQPWPVGAIQEDFRLAIQCADDRGFAERGIIQSTPWASELVHGGGDGEEEGWSQYATDANAYDPDAFRIILLKKPWPNEKIGIELLDVQFGLRLADASGTSERGWEQYTPWLMAQNGGWSEWGFDANGYDPDAISVALLVRFRQMGASHN